MRHGESSIRRRREDVQKCFTFPELENVEYGLGEYCNRGGERRLKMAMANVTLWQEVLCPSLAEQLTRH